MRGRLSFFTLVLLLAWAPPIHAWMHEVGDEVLSEITGEGFSSFTIENGVARAYFNIEATTYTQIDSLKMGYYDNGTTTGWDQDWTEVSFGSPDTDLFCKGLYLEAGFTNLTDPGSRQLDYVKFGTPDMTGPISANFSSFSGTINAVDYNRVNLGVKTIISTNSEFSVSLNRTTGWRVEWTNATITP